jgi:mRNA interferase MazF
VIAHGDVVWTDFGTPRGSEPGKRRPAVVMQSDWLLATKIGTVLVVPMTSNLGLQSCPGNVFVPMAAAGLDKDSVVVVTQLGPVSREYLDPFPIGRLSADLLKAVAAGIRLALDL